MSNLESIVPPLDLCKKIPAGEFEDSALVWYRFWREYNVRPREQWIWPEEDRPVPAPTLEEILDALADLGADFLMHEFQLGNKSYCYPTGVEEAILLWFEIKRIEVQ